MKTRTMPPHESKYEILSFFYFMRPNRDYGRTRSASQPAYHGLKELDQAIDHFLVVHLYQTKSAIMALPKPTEFPEETAPGGTNITAERKLWEKREGIR
jgi:hypothetical protein